MRAQLRSQTNAQPSCCFYYDCCCPVTTTTTAHTAASGALLPQQCLLKYVKSTRPFCTWSLMSNHPASHDATNQENQERRVAPDLEPEGEPSNQQHMSNITQPQTVQTLGGIVQRGQAAMTWIPNVGRKRACINTDPSLDVWICGCFVGRWPWLPGLAYDCTSTCQVCSRRYMVTSDGTMQWGIHHLGHVAYFDSRQGFHSPLARTRRASEQAPYCSSQRGPGFETAY